MFLYCAASILILLLVYLKYHKVSTYWEKKGVKVVNISLLSLLWSYLTTHSLSRLVYKVYTLSDDDDKLVGFYVASYPILLVRDPELSKTILVKDFSSLQHRGLGVGDTRFANNLVNLEGYKWQLLRRSQASEFTTHKLKQATPIFVEAASRYIKGLNKTEQETSIIELKNSTEIFSSQAMVTLVFGLDMDVAMKNPEFQKMVDTVFKSNLARKVAMVLYVLVPKLINSLSIPFISSERVNYTSKLTKDILKEREKDKNLRNDFMDYVMKLKEQKVLSFRHKEGPENQFEITDWVLASQPFVYFSTGVEAPSNVSSFLLYELAMNPNIQEKCFEEIQKMMAKCNKKPTYESFSELTYLKMCLKESLRKYPNGSMLVRRSTSDYTFPNTNVAIEKDSLVVISVIGIHRDPKNYPNPEVFDPERFSPERQHQIPNGAYLPFGDGPRRCIAMRLAELAVLVCVSHILYEFKLEPCGKTKKNVSFNPYYELSLVSNEGLWVKLTKRKKDYI